MRRVNAVVGVVLLTVIMLAGAAVAQSAPKSDLEARRKALNELLTEQWEYNLRTSPEFATILGDKRYNDKLSDFSQKAIDAELAQTKQFLAQFEAIDTTGFPEQEALNKALMVRQLRREVEGERFKGWEMPVNQGSGIHILIPQFVTLLPFTNVKDYEDYIARMKQAPRVFDETMVQMRNGMRDGLMPPKFLLEKVVTQAQAIADMPAEKTPFAQPVEKFPAEIG